MISQQDRLNLRQFGWANGMMNVAFIAGKMRRQPGNNRLVLIQQTPALEQSIPVMLGAPLSESAFPDGTYISVMARLTGRAVLDDAARPKEGFAILSALNVRYVEAREVSLDVAQKRLQRALAGTNAAARTDDLTPMDVQVPPEVSAFTLSSVADSGEAEADAEGAATTDDGEERVSMLKNSNVIRVAGVIGFMEHRPAEIKADGKVGSSERVTLFLQQHGDLARSVPIRIYGKQAQSVVEAYQPGAAIFVAGQLLVDVKKGADNNLRLTPYVKTFSIELAQPNVHIRTTPYPEWATALYELGGTPKGFAKLTRRISTTVDGAGAAPEIDAAEQVAQAAAADGRD
jgi:hypothetical protein